MKKKLILEFDEEDAGMELIYIHAPRLHSVLTELHNEIRSYMKHGHQFPNADTAFSHIYHNYLMDIVHILYGD
ncbi:MAG: hypothetical protein KatS3mg002_0427 [Candidatus Woesearchaeota archaeon]|nr:MAG: hypothetical protein KatS3mg002_0427 [Candidatus Woesearchaeota archaeon]